MSSERARDVEVVDLAVPGGSGSSNETLLCTLRWRVGPDARIEEFVVRVKSRGLSHRRDTFELQYQVQRAVAIGTEAPMARIHWYEADPAVLGAPFWVMERVRGEVPADRPPNQLWE